MLLCSMLTTKFFVRELILLSFRISFVRKDQTEDFKQKRLITINIVLYCIKKEIKFIDE